jgi:hypothetical protein
LRPAPAGVHVEGLPDRFAVGDDAVHFACATPAGARELAEPLAASATANPPTAIEPASNAPTPPRTAHPRADVMSSLHHT